MALGRTAAQPTDPVVFHARDAIMGALAYFSNPDLTLDKDAVLLYAYLKDRFGLPELCGAREVLTEIREGDHTDQFYMFLRLAEPIPCEMDFLEPTGGLNDYALCAVWYDELEDRSMLTQRISEAPLHEPYVVTHALWAMAIAQHCFQAELDTALERQIAELNMDLILRNRPQWGDVVIEALAMGQYHDPSYIPPATYIREIVDLQNLDGSWNWVVGDENTKSQHTTILALWALLQYQPLAWPVKPRDIVLR